MSRDTSENIASPRLLAIKRPPVPVMPHQPVIQTSKGTKPATSRPTNFLPLPFTIYLLFLEFDISEPPTLGNCFPFPALSREPQKSGLSCPLLLSLARPAEQLCRTSSKPSDIQSQRSVPTQLAETVKGGDWTSGRARLWTGRRSEFRKIVPKSQQAVCLELWMLFYAARS